MIRKLFPPCDKFQAEEDEKTITGKLNSEMSSFIPYYKIIGCKGTTTDAARMTHLHIDFFESF